MSLSMASRPSKRRKITPPPADGDDASAAKIQKAFFRSAASWSLEQDYETRPRKGKKKDRESSRLPIKTAGGLVQQVPSAADDAASVESDTDWLDGPDGEAGEAAPRERAPEAPRVPEREQVRMAKEELAKIGLALNESPEDNPGAFKALAAVGRSRLPAVQKLCLVTQMAVYKDVIPGYRIRPATEDGPQEKLSREVRTLRSFEQALVSGYQNYLKELARLARLGRPSSDGATRGLAAVAVSCACTLVTAVPHFNFRGELLRILVGRLSTRRVDESYVRCQEALETFFRDDEEGRPSMEAVSLLTKMMRARDYQVDERVLNLLLHLRLLSEYSGKASRDEASAADGGPARGRHKKVFRTKRDRKSLKEQKALQKDLDVADALVSHEERDKMQSETLKLVFGAYFRILKLRVPHLMGAVLEGLAKYAHLINQDFFGDLLEALKDLIRHSDADADADADANAEPDEDEPVVRNPSREALLCTVTAFALLSGQDAHNARSDLHLDLSFFVAHLFRSLFPLALHPDLELGARSLHLPDPDGPAAPAAKPNRVNLQTTTVLLVRCLTAVLLPPWNIRSVPPLRLAAFTKQLASVALHMPERSCQAVLALLNDVAHTHGRKVAALWNTEERKGDGTFNPLSESVEGSNPFAATVWEGELLRRHYCPKVREGVAMLEKSLKKA